MLAYRVFETDEMKGGMKDGGKQLKITHAMIEKMKSCELSPRRLGSWQGLLGQDHQTGVF